MTFIKEGAHLFEIFPSIFRVVIVYILYIQSGYISDILSVLVGAIISNTEPNTVLQSRVLGI